MAIINKRRIVPREYGRNKRIVGGSTSSGLSSSSGAVGSSSWLEEYFSLDDIGNLRLTQNLFGEGEIAAFVGATPPIDNWWDSMPYATDLSVGGVRVLQSTATYEDGIRLNSTTKKLQIDPTYGGGGGSSVWGDITGTLSSQTDLWNELQLKYSSSNNNIGTGASNYSAGNHLHSGIYAIIGGQGTQDFATNNLSVSGDLTISGKINEVETEIVQSENDLIITRFGATSGLVAGTYTGFQAKLYDGTNDGQLVFGSDGLARVGDIGDLQVIATRETSPLSNGIAYYDITSKQFKTKTEASLSVGTASNSDTLDSYHASAFPRKSENAVVSGEWNISKLGIGKTPIQALDVSGSLEVSGRVRVSSQWSLGFNGTDLIFYNSSNVATAKLSQSGTLTSSGDIVAYGTI